jgi:hypothetical protein
MEVFHIRFFKTGNSGLFIARFLFIKDTYDKGKAYRDDSKGFGHRCRFELPAAAQNPGVGNLAGLHQGRDRQISVFICSVAETTT